VPLISQYKKKRRKKLWPQVVLNLVPRILLKTESQSGALTA
jgi:hypothetical protein